MADRRRLIVRFVLVIVFAMPVGLAACASVPSGDSYSREQMERAATVMKGRVLALREVKVSGTKSGVGVVAGAGAGGVAGSKIGSGARANILGAILGAVVGGLIGAATEQELAKAGAVEFVIKQEDGQVIAVVQTNEEGLKVGDDVLILRSDRVRVVRNQIAKADQ